MTNIKHLTKTLWNEFIGSDRAANCSLSLTDEGDVLVSCENNNKLFNTDTYGDIPAYVKTLTNTDMSVEFLTNIDRFTAWRTLLNEVGKVVGVKGSIVVSLNLDAYYAEISQDLIRKDQDFSKLIKTFTEQGFLVTDYQPHMDYLNDLLVRNLCSSSEINDDEWIRIISWVGEHRCLSEFIRFLHEQYFIAIPTVISNQVWLKLCQPDTDIDKRVAAVKTMTLSDNAVFKSQLNKHLEHIPCAVMWYRLSAYMKKELGIDNKDYLSDNNMRLFSKWANQPILDQQALSIAKEWFNAPVISEALKFNNVPMGECFVYELTADVLEFCLHARED